jgi:polysaccharide export outer membrane protein
MRYILFVVTIICFGPVIAIAQSGSAAHVSKNQKRPANQLPNPAPEPVAEDFVIGPEDVLEISVWREPDLTMKVVVRTDGKVSVRLLNDVQASGLTTKQLQQQLQDAFAKYVAEPVVSVIVLDVHSQVAHIIGSVARPGVYPLGRPLTVMELLARAGGLADFAKKEDIAVVRSEGGKTRRLPFNYKSFIEGSDLQQNILLKSGDIVVVP